MAKRAFRTEESYEAERRTRGMIRLFLQDRGYFVELDSRERRGQTITARSPAGERVSMRVRLCWRRDARRGKTGRAPKYSAAQLMAKIRDEDWVGSLEEKVERERSHGVTHLLLVQRDTDDITHAALIPLSAVLPIWTGQRDVSRELIAEGKLGRRKKNHAMNGSSPTLWLQDDDAPEVPDVLWGHAGVEDLAQLPVIDPPTLLAEEIADPRTYMEGASRRVWVNAYERDRRAREECIARHGTQCRICDFDFGAHYGPEADGHIHVHHIRPLSDIRDEYEVDPVTDLVPVCPNCHAVIHLGGGCRSIEEVREMISAPHASPRTFGTAGS
jgi:5-methylcytosine-specific restriction enzyme A